MTDASSAETPYTGVNVQPKIFFLAFLLLLFKPMLSVDGSEPVPIAWGVNFVALAPGRHSLRCYVPYLWYRHMGDSTIEMDLPPGATPTVRWRAPWLVFLSGTWKVIAPD